MRTILDQPRKGGKRRVVVELDEGEILIALQPNSHYRLSYPLEDQIMGTHIIDSPRKVVWDSLEQKWLDA